MEQLKIALTGKMRSGKDTVGEILIKGYGFRRYAFGDGIKEIIESYFPSAFLEGKPRRHYQHIGQSLRELDEDVWVNYCLDKVADNHYDNVVVTDARQPNEIEALRANGFIIVKVECDEETRIERMKANNDNFNIEDLKHETELNVDLVIPDVYLYNNLDLATLERRVHALVRYAKSRQTTAKLKEAVNG